MDLKRRLAALDKLTRRPDALARPAAPSDLPPSLALPAAMAALELTERGTTAGPVWCRQQNDPSDPPPSPMPDLTGFFPRLGDPSPSPGQILLLDTETTGLAGGTGTLVFQLGVSWWQGRELVTRQYFLPGPGHECAMLADLAELARDFKVLVTFNGASFDLPLLRTRALLNRVPDPLRHLRGWDLLVPGRRLWGNRLPDCRQQTLEVELCGEQRLAGDIDGAAIPQAWFDFLSTGQPGQLPQVLTHNRRDMLGMARIFGLVCAVAAGLDEEPGGAWPAAWEPAWRDREAAWALGRICEHRGRPSAAAAWFARSWGLGWRSAPAPAIQARFRRDAIRNLKRCQCWDLVEAVVADGLRCDQADVALHREAAILYEHRLVDLGRAEEHAVRAGDGHRLARLQRRRAGRS